MAAPPRKNWLLPAGVASGLLLVLAGLWAAGVFKLRTKDGTIVVEDLPADAEVLVDGEKVAVKLSGDGRRIEVQVAPGKRTLEIKAAGFKMETREVSLASGERQPIGIRLEPLAGGPEKTERAPRHKNSLGMEFVLVPRGKAWLGGGAGRPGTEVEIGYDFYLGQYEVTQEEWERVLGLNPSTFKAVEGVPKEDLRRFPVEQVSWEDCQEFIKRVNEHAKEAGWVYRLPRGTEWEYACRGGPMKEKSEGSFDYYLDRPSNVLLAEQANFAGDKSLGRTCKVGLYKPNRLGLYDMHGNVWEWCDDTENVSERAFRQVTRGGGWFFGANFNGDCRAASRPAYAASTRISCLGLRLARVPADKASNVDSVPQPPAKRTRPQFTNTLDMDFVLVPRGKAWLGGGAGIPGTEVEIGYDFYLGQYEVTQEEWEKVTGATPSAFKAMEGVPKEDLRRFPVEQVSWEDCQEFIKRVNEQAKEVGWVYRLPKGTEWEYACRGGPMKEKFESAFDFYLDRPSNVLLRGQANFATDRDLGRACKVGSYQPNRLGLYDMHGNVWEWCDDAVNVKDGGPLRVTRGGGWSFGANFNGDCRAAHTHAWAPATRSNCLGLRLARVPSGKASN
jgi:formylglycine-generating enzyme required for sulfatase activity